MGYNVQIAAADGGTFGAYVAYPDAPTAPGLVLGQYICGVNNMMRELADEFARQGFVTVVPDLFWRQQPGVQLNNNPQRPSPADGAMAMQLNAGFDDAAGVGDVRSTADWLSRHQRCVGGVGFLGYCLGGRLALLLAKEPSFTAVVSYYGVDLNRYLGQSIPISQPLLMHFAGADEHVSESERARAREELSPNPKVRIFSYGGCGHQFALPRSANFSQENAALADGRSIAFLKEHFGTSA